MAADGIPEILSRRTALAAGIGSLATALAARAAESPAPVGRREAPRFDDPIWNREMAAKLQAHTDGRQVYGCCTGTISGVRPGEAARHLMGFEVFSTIRVVRQSNGSYDRMSKEVVFYTDPKTGAILDEWDNPYTGERVRVVDIANDPYNWIIREYIGAPPVPGVDVKNAPEPAEKKPFLMPWRDFGPDTVAVAQDFHGYYKNKLDPAKWKRESAGEMVRSSELFRYFVRRADLENPDLDHLPHNGSWVRVTPWLPWMLMGQSEGHILYDGIFRPNETLDYISPPVLARVRAKYPQYLTAPTTWYGPSLSSIEHYALEQKPAPAR
jgi:hypothetical protein